MQGLNTRHLFETELWTHFYFPSERRRKISNDNETMSIHKRSQSPFEPLFPQEISRIRNKTLLQPFIFLGSFVKGKRNWPRSDKGKCALVLSVQSRSSRYIYIITLILRPRENRGHPKIQPKLSGDTTSTTYADTLFLVGILTNKHIMPSCDTNSLEHWHTNFLKGCHYE